jgi:hypothetical protein
VKKNGHIKERLEKRIVAGSFESAVRLGGQPACHLLDMTANLVRSSGRQIGQSRGIHGSKHDADEIVFDHDAVQEGDSPLDAIFVLGVFERGDDGDESSEGFEAAFDALGGSGSCENMLSGQAKYPCDMKNALSPPFTRLH